MGQSNHFVWSPMGKKGGGIEEVADVSEQDQSERTLCA